MMSFLDGFDVPLEKKSRNQLELEHSYFKNECEMFEKRYKPLIKALQIFILEEIEDHEENSHHR